MHLYVTVWYRGLGWVHNLNDEYTSHRWSPLSLWSHVLGRSFFCILLTALTGEDTIYMLYSKQILNGWFRKNMQKLEDLPVWDKLVGWKSSVIPVFLRLQLGRCDPRVVGFLLAVPFCKLTWTIWQVSDARLDSTCNLRITRQYHWPPS